MCYVNECQVCVGAHRGQNRALGVDSLGDKVTGVGVEAELSLWKCS